MFILREYPCRSGNGFSDPENGMQMFIFANIQKNTNKNDKPFTQQKEHVDSPNACRSKPVSLHDHENIDP